MFSVKRIPSLDGLRAISILLVVVGHLAKSRHAPQIFWEYYAETGVRIFFVISGFLITTILSNEHAHTATISLRTFYLRRAYRIFPAALVFMLVMVIAYWRDLRWYNIASAFFYLANFDYTRPWIFGHLWSLSVEEQFYFLWPSILKRWYKHRTAILVGVIALAPVGQAILYLAKIPGGNIGAFPGVAGNLAAGCLLAVVAHRLPRINWYSALFMLTAVVLIPLFAANTRGKTLLLVFILSPVLHLSIAGFLLHVVQVPYAILNWRPVAWLGKISYSLYLWQQPFCSDPNLRSGYLVLLALAVACLSYYLVELPMLRRRENKVHGPQEISSVGAPVSTPAA
jgi:peptidoglycan/LPS O-acetylase OafA/YrhL